MRASDSPRAAIALLVVLTLAGCERENIAVAARPAEADAPRVIDADLAFVGVNVLPMTFDTVLPNQTVLVKGETIVALGPRGEIMPDAGAAIVNGAGRYLMPGLADMHVHIEDERNFLPLVAYGVTFIRNMWGMPQHLQWRAKIESGEILGPRMITAGAIVDGPVVVWTGSAAAGSAEDVRRIMDQQQASGYDFFKIYENMALDVFDGVAEHSQVIGMAFGGHVPTAVPLEHALRTDMVSIEHLTGWNLATAIRGGRLEAAESITREVPGKRRLALAEIGRDLAADTVQWSTLTDEQRRADLAALAARSRAWHVPTLIELQRIHTSRRQSSELLSRPEARWMTPLERACAHPDADFRLQMLSDEQLESLQALFEDSLRQVAALRAAGARLLVGSDAPNPFVLYGYSVHEELALLVEAGLSPYEALVAATRAPAEFLQDTSFGTVEVGKRADLVLLDANPLDNITASRNIAGVMLRGRWLPEWELTSMLDAMVGGFSSEPVTCPM